MKFFFLLIKDLCRRLPYGIRCKCGYSDTIYILKGINPDREGASFAQLTSVMGIIYRFRVHYFDYRSLIKNGLAYIINLLIYF